MQRWHLACFAWVNSGRCFSLPPFAEDPKWLFLCLCRETNRRGCKWKVLLLIHKQGASSQGPSQLDSLGYPGWEWNAKQSPWGFHQAAAFAGHKSPRGLVHCSSPFCILRCLQVRLFVSPQEQRVYKKTLQHWECMANAPITSLQNLLHVSRKGHRGAAHCLQRSTVAQVLQREHLRAKTVRTAAQLSSTKHFGTFSCTSHNNLGTS